MSDFPFISICIPAYKRIDFLQRLLDSIIIQTYRDFEVVVSDDSPDETVRMLCEAYRIKVPLRYYRNNSPLGTPENWNEAIRHARGEWIKIMHDDDWFAKAESLDRFAKAVAANSGARFVFSAYTDVFLDEGRERKMFVPPVRYRSFLRDKAVLFAKNIIGPPSVVLYRRIPPVEYDRTVKWVVDKEFYIRYLGDSTPVYIPEILIKVGLGKTQVTVDCKLQRVIEIPENFYLLNKVGCHHLKNVIVYDAWWRLMRNLEIRKLEDMTDARYDGPVPSAILSMVRWQRLLPFRLWRIGPLSKVAMFLNYLVNYSKIPA